MRNSRRDGDQSRTAARASTSPPSFSKVPTPAMIVGLLGASALNVCSFACTTDVVRFTHRDAAGITGQEAGSVPSDGGQALDQRSDQPPGGDREMDARAVDGSADIASSDRQIPDGLPDRAQQPPLFRYVEYVCCRMDVPTDCVTAFLGSAQTCFDASSWKEAAFHDCDRQGALLTDYSAYLDCSSEALTPGSAPAPRCFFAEKAAVQDKDTRCLVCDEGSGAATQYCEFLSCTTVQAEPPLRCEQCRWSRQPSILCDVCYDQATGTTRDTCHGQKPPE